ncbi:dipeptide/oligopeptide/nickel ABC transporter permease/ATP-binding protein [Leadbettera azotonutricia]|uniref:Peptide/opine/nickel uptake family ABC transporter, permease/ATP-binding protein n=1 Tax=Leadbettera azotonutricia (strain ATCC BAA-888 / DSM 13862 / ZAS-9) TaxID=545695 RepID=F5YG59_LEAAZ|nr:dipeptide/oligopeptide/nickel ABC transporter permease/ATP-binding protein [Leadbettera azotonutricia]AEF80626.1 peptide/opine/nickel uptake family ABC transporter, permease/ATP-binding protein [Leadbettera azotonutricia ZAS-9]
MKKFLVYVKSRPLGFISLVLLCLLYLCMIFAEFIAPYPAATTFGEMSYHPPNGRFYNGTFQAQEFRVTSTVAWKYARIRDSYEKVRFLGKGTPYKLLGLIPMERHLFTTARGAYPIFLMGADNLGRDIFSRIIHGSRISLTIGFVATAISLALAVLFGGLAGYYGGATDWSIMRICEFFMLIPGLYLILFLRSLLSSNMDSGQAYMMITVILSLVGWPGSARTIRGMVHAIKREEFVMNSQLEMIPSTLIITRDIIPQISSLLIVSIALSIPGFIMTETTLSYLGLGIVDPAVSWGSMIKRDISTLNNLKNYPWLLNPVWFLLGVTLAFNFLGDALRDYYDPYHTVFFKFPPFFRKKKNENPPDSKSVNMNSNTANYDSIAANTPLLELHDVTVDFSVLRGKEHIKVQAVRGVSFDLAKGEILGIVGESGSGKSVTTQAIPDLLPKNASVQGSILYEGKELTGLAINDLRLYRGKKIGMIFQEPGRSYDPLQNMGSVFFETFHNSDPYITRDAAMEKAEALLKETGLDNSRERLSNFPHQFSGGQLQRIGIALALAQGCELLVADEPTTALDVTIQKQIIELLRALRKTRRISIIFISHDIDLVADISDRILVMYGGLIMEAGGSGTISGGAALHPYTKALLAASPSFGSHYSKSRLLAIPGRVTDPSNPEPGCPFAPRCTKAKPECTSGIPPLALKEEGHEVRCVCIDNQEATS